MRELLPQNWWAVAIRGVAALILGVMAFAMPADTLQMLMILFGIYAVTDGLVLVFAGAASRRGRRTREVTRGGLAIIVGVIALLQPAAAAVAFAYLLGAWCFVTGVLEIMAAVGLAAVGPMAGVLGVAGALSAFLGIAILAFPDVALVLLAWYVGAYAIAFGGLLTIFALWLRGSRRSGGTLEGGRGSASGAQV
jgi:uncharacterized membrane protein HdeD (DUF308 family)